MLYVNVSARKLLYGTVSVTFLKQLANYNREALWLLLLFLSLLPKLVDLFRVLYTDTLGLDWFLIGSGVH